jgi:hypothetical protein
VANRVQTVFRPLDMGIEKSLIAITLLLIPGATLGEE